PHDPHVRMVPTVTSVTLDGAQVPYQMSWDDSRRIVTAKIGDPGKYLNPGTHDFVIHSVVPNALAPSNVGEGLSFASSTGETAGSPSVFYWFVIKSWNNRIAQADISVTLPAGTQGVQCTIGWGRGEPCPEPTITGNRIEMSIPNLAPRTPVTFRAGLDIATPP